MNDPTTPAQEERGYRYVERDDTVFREYPDAIVELGPGEQAIYFELRDAEARAQTAEAERDRLRTSLADLRGTVRAIRQVADCPDEDRARAGVDRLCDTALDDIRLALGSEGADG